jgi:hypothetical protein
MPDNAKWSTAKGAMALLMYADLRKAANPREAILEFLESAYQAGARRADWDVKAFHLSS